MASSQFIDLNSQPILESEVLGYGESGVVIHRDSMAIKTPLRHPWNNEVPHCNKYCRLLTESHRG